MSKFEEAVADYGDDDRQVTVRMLRDLTAAAEALSANSFRAMPRPTLQVFVRRGNDPRMPSGEEGRDGSAY